MDTRFQQVWNRVSASAADTHEDRLEQFINDERRDAEEYTLLARRSRSAEARRLFQKLSSEEREHLRRLQTMAYLLRENGAAPQKEADKPANADRPLQAIRRRYAAERKSAEAYQNAAERTKDGKLRSLFLSLAADEQRHGEALWALLQKHW